jgi:hypothetical protein
MYSLKPLETIAKTWFRRAKRAFVRDLDPPRFAKPILNLAKRDSGARSEPFYASFDIFFFAKTV